MHLERHVAIEDLPTQFAADVKEHSGRDRVPYGALTAESRIQTCDLRIMRPKMAVRNSCNISHLGVWRWLLTANQSPMGTQQAPRRIR